MFEDITTQVENYQISEDSSTLDLIMDLIMHLHINFHTLVLIRRTSYTE